MSDNDEDDDDDDDEHERGDSDDEDKGADSSVGKSGGSWWLQPPTSCYAEDSDLAVLNSFRPARKGGSGYSATDVRYFQSLNKSAHTRGVRPQLKSTTAQRFPFICVVMARLSRTATAKHLLMSLFNSFRCRLYGLV